MRGCLPALLLSTASLGVFEGLSSPDVVGHFWLLPSSCRGLSLPALRAVPALGGYPACLGSSVLVQHMGLVGSREGRCWQCLLPTHRRHHLSVGNHIVCALSSESQEPLLLLLPLTVFVTPLIVQVS